MSRKNLMIALAVAITLPLLCQAQPWSDHPMKQRRQRAEIESKMRTMKIWKLTDCLLYTSPSPRDLSTSRMPSSA